MNAFGPWIQAAGAIQLIYSAINLALPRKLGYRENLAKVSPMMRQVFIVHSVYIALIVLGLALLCLFFAPDLAGGSPLGRTLCGAIALFWLGRLPVQLFYYDPAVRRANRAVDVAVILGLVYLAGVMGAAALGGGVQ